MLLLSLRTALPEYAAPVSNSLRKRAVMPRLEPDAGQRGVQLQ
jgi:hypothetical protein